jgi:hypothetical protein
LKELTVRRLAEAAVGGASKHAHEIVEFLERKRFLQDG